MYILECDASWCESHAERRGDGFWYCKATGEGIDSVIVRRSLQDGKAPLSGSGKVVEVIHLSCPGCNPNWKPPSTGAQISPSEISQI